jgi:hypothetical protein
MMQVKCIERNLNKVEVKFNPLHFLSILCSLHRLFTFDANRQTFGLFSVLAIYALISGHMMPPPDRSNLTHYKYHPSIHVKP